MSNRVLVTGATGFVGANLVRRLVGKNFEVHILTRKSSSLWRIGDTLSLIKNHIADLREEKRLKTLLERIRPDIIFHFANAGVYGGISSPDRYVLETNFLGTINLIKACDDIDYKCFVNTGSSAEYGAKDGPMKESDICEPVNIYGISKLASTLYGQFIAEAKNKPIVCLRLFSPFGPYDDKRRLMTYAITRALQNKPLDLANPNAVRDYIYIEDVLDAYMLCIKKAKYLPGEIFNVGSGHQIRVKDVVDKILRLTHSKSLTRWNEVPARIFDAKRWEAGIIKASKVLGWKPKHPIDKGIEKTVGWFRRNIDLYENFS